MFDRQSTHVAMLFWGGVFCMLAALYMAMAKNYDFRKRKWLFAMQLSTAILLFNDTLAWAFHGYEGEAGYYWVRISNFMVFTFSNVTLLFFHQYVCQILGIKKDKKATFRVKIVSVIALLGAVLVIISQFNNMYYYFDSDNVYHRNSWNVISMIIPMLGMCIDFSLLIQFRRNISKKMFVSISSYIVLPVLAAVIQIVYYGFSLINIAICISMLLMYIVAMGEQNQEIAILSRKQAQTKEQLDISTVLNKCVMELTSDVDINTAINNLLIVINDYFNADRCYIFEADYEKDIVVNTYEYAKPGVSKQIDNLKEVPMSVISEWMESFRKNQLYYIEGLEQEKGRESYDILDDQQVDSLLAVPIYNKGKNDIIGFLGVDNPREHCNDATLLSSIQYFVTNSLMIKAEQDKLKYLSYRDMLTNIYNRNKYIDVVDGYKNSYIEKIGVIYIDLNGLKAANDKYGHEAGDRLICNAAQVIDDVFPKKAYRVGGDEFVIICSDIHKNKFNDKIKVLCEKMDKNGVSISLGMLWREHTKNLQNMLKEADRRMYEEKERYHRLIKNKA